MRKPSGFLLIAGTVALAGIVSGSPLWSESEHKTSLELAFTYEAVQANLTTTNNVWLQGGSVQWEGRFYRGLGVVADVSGTHNGNLHGSGVGLDLITTTFGPRYTLRFPTPTHRLVVYGQSLVGIANGINSVFPGSPAAGENGTSLATLVGGGINVPLTGHLTVRALEANWLRTQLPNATTGVQNSVRLGAGIVYRFKK